MMRTPRSFGEADRAGRPCERPTATRPVSTVIAVELKSTVRLLAVEHVQDLEDGFEALADVRFRATERREPARRQLRLHMPQIVAAQGQILQQVESARPLRLRNGRQKGNTFVVASDNAGAHLLKIANERAELRFHDHSYSLCVSDSVTAL